MAKPGLEKGIKFKRFVSVLKCPRSHARGYLEEMWDVGYENAHPHLGDAFAVALACDFPGEPELIAKALLEAAGPGHPGFIEISDDGDYFIHHLYENAPVYVRRRMDKRQLSENQPDAERKRKSDAGKKGAKARWANPPKPCEPNGTLPFSAISAIQPHPKTSEIDPEKPSEECNTNGTLPSENAIQMAESQKKCDLMAPPSPPCIQENTEDSRLFNISEKEESKNRDPLLVDPRSTDDKTNPDPKKPRRTSARDSLFDAFWSNYPRKTHKIAAQKAWKKLGHVTLELLQTMLKTLEWQRKSNDWTKKGGEFVPYPASWIEGQRWTDEPTKIAETVKLDPFGEPEIPDTTAEEWDARQTKIDSRYHPISGHTPEKIRELNFFYSSAHRPNALGFPAPQPPLETNGTY